ncbi:MAG: hypothetical protein HKO71_01185, partial [Pseudomonadales bacterium]|nr:hypothetical protein [Pseudomonadales bacterium]
LHRLEGIGCSVGGQHRGGRRCCLCILSGGSQACWRDGGSDRNDGSDSDEHGTASVS